MAKLYDVSFDAAGNALGVVERHQSPKAPYRKVTFVPRPKGGNFDGWLVVIEANSPEQARELAKAQLPKAKEG